MGLYQSKNFCTAKETIKKWKDNLWNERKIFVNHVSDKGLIYKMYKELVTQQQNNNNNNNL